MKNAALLVLLVLLLSVLFVTRAIASTTYWFDANPTTIQFNPQPVFSQTDSGHTCTELQPSNTAWFACNSASIVWTGFVSSAASRTYALYQRASNLNAWTLISTTAFPNTPDSTYVPVTLATGLDTSQVYQYKVTCITPLQGASNNWFDANIILDTGSLSSAVQAHRFVWGMYGDSITAVTNASPAITDTRLADMWQFCAAADASMIISGTAGGKVVNTGRDSTHNIPPGVDGMRNEYGTNDLPDLGSPVPNAIYQQAYSDMVDNEIAWIGSGKPIYCLQPFPRASNGANRALCGSLIQAAIAGKPNVYYINTDNWWDPNNGSLTGDGLHPNEFGYAFLANRELPVFSSVALSMIAPARGTSGTASGNFVITLSGGATFTGDQDVTVGSPAGNITATAAGGTISNNGTGNVTVTPTSGVSSFTFTVNATGGGTSLVTPSSAQALWTMPTPATFNANVVTPGNPSRGPARFP